MTTLIIKDNQPYASLDTLAELKGRDKSTVSRQCKDAPNFTIGRTKYLSLDCEYLNDITMPQDLQQITYEQALQQESATSSSPRRQDWKAAYDELLAQKEDLYTRFTETYSTLKAAQQKSKDLSERNISLVAELKELRTLQGKYDESSTHLNTLRHNATQLQQQLEAARRRIDSLTQELERTHTLAQQQQLEAQADQQALQQKHETVLKDNARLTQLTQAAHAHVTTIEDELMEYKLGQAQGVNPIEQIVTSRKFNVAFVVLVMLATFFVSLTKLMSTLWTPALLHFTSGIAYFIISSALAFAVIWYSYNKSSSTVVNALVLAILFLCEWVSFSQFTGMTTGIHLIDNVLRSTVFSFFLPSLTLLLAHIQGKNAQSLTIPHATAALQRVLRLHSIHQVARITVDYKKEILNQRTHTRPKP